MANNYLEFSESLDNLTKEEIDWLKYQLQSIYVFGDQEYDDCPSGLDPVNTTWKGIRLFRDRKNADGDYDAAGECDAEFENDFLGFEWEICNDPLQETNALWIYAQESGNAWNAAYLVRKFLNKFRPQESWRLTYSYTCSKPRIGEFGGGAVYVTATDIVHADVGDFLASCHKQNEQLDRPTIVLSLCGGAVQDVYSSHPELQVVLVDWDVDWDIEPENLESENPDDPKYVNVRLSGGQNHWVHVTEMTVAPLAEMTGTDVDSAFQASGLTISRTSS